eukprot:m.40865 g.40865  ORF g.40865 m.40865 type:complete len:70 (+) comp12786_c0_seq1:17-226(+)
MATLSASSSYQVSLVVQVTSTFNSNEEITSFHFITIAALKVLQSSSTLALLHSRRNTPASASHSPLGLP